MPPTLPRGRWLRVCRVTENGVRGWALDELAEVNGALEVRRIHGPDLFEIVTLRAASEVRHG
jgi:hypothetical protein